MDWFLLPPATHTIIEEVSKAGKGRFIGDPSYVYEHLEIQRQGEGDEAVEDEVVVSMISNEQCYIILSQIIITVIQRKYFSCFFMH